MKRINVILDRNSVCMGDDCFSHTKEIDIFEDMTLRDFILYARKIPPERTYNESGYISKQIEVFPYVGGGRATWILTIRKNREEICALAVIAQQWEEPKLLVDNLPIGEILLKYDSNEFFMKYLSQVDPEKTYNEVIADITK